MREKKIERGRYRANCEHRSRWVFDRLRSERGKEKWKGLLLDEFYQKH